MPSTVIPGIHIFLLEANDWQNSSECCLKKMRSLGEEDKGFLSLRKCLREMPRLVDSGI